MRLRIGFFHSVGAMVGLLLLCLTSSPQNNEAYTAEAEIDSSFLFQLNTETEPVKRTGNGVWEDTVYNEAFSLYKKGQYAQAASVYKRACDGFARACTNLGFMYNKGQGVKMSHSLAAEYYKRGCENGNALGCTNLGIMYWKGDLPRNDKHVVVLFERSCRDGDSGGCRDLGYMYKHGYGVSKDETRAAELYKQAEHSSHIHRIPFHLEDGLILVSLNIQEENSILIIDTGSERTALNRKFTPPGSILQPGVSVSTMLGSGQADAIDVIWKLDGRELRLPVLIGDFGLSHNVVGVLGADILSRFTSVRFDYVNLVLTLED
jgi:hypothetical protein